MQTPAETNKGSMGIVFIVSAIAAFFDWRYKRQGGKKPTARDRWMFCAACGVCLICLATLGLMGASAGGDVAGALGEAIPGVLIVLFALWELGRWRVRRKNPVVSKATSTEKP